MGNKVEGKMEADATQLRKWGYENVHLIGSGAFSRVYRLQDVETKHIAACKVSERKDLLYREAELLKQLTHPLFPAYYEMRQTTEKGFLFMEYVPGSNLEELLMRRGKFSPGQGIEIAAELAEGILILHGLEEQVLYLDLKPANIIVRENGQAVLVDMGSAGNPERMKEILTGTKGYAAPEQLRAEGQIGTYSDVYALGKVMRRICPSYPAGVEQLLEGCLRERMGERIPDMRYFLRRIALFRTKREKRCLFQKKRVTFGKTGNGGILFEKNIVKIR